MPNIQEETLAVCPHCKHPEGKQTKVVVENGQLARHKRPGYLAWKDPSCQELLAEELKAELEGTGKPKSKRAA